jgi:hypothetical protein
MVLVALLGLGFQLQLPRAFPSDADYRGVASALAAAPAQGDVVFLHPWWTERARLFFPPDLKVVGYLGHTADDLLEHPRIWCWPTSGFPARRTPTSGGISCPTASRRVPRSSSARSLSPRTGTVGRDGWSSRPPMPSTACKSRWKGPAGAAAQPCQRSGSRVQCPFDASVEVAWHEVLYQPVRCLYVLPPSGDGRSRSPCPTGLRQTRSCSRPASAGSTPGSRTAPPWSSGWRAPRGCSTSAFPPGARDSCTERPRPWQPDRGRCRLTTADPHDRQLCLRLRALGGPP